MKETHQFEKAFGPGVSFAGKTLFIVGLILLFYSTIGLILLLLGAFLGFTNTCTIIDFDKRKVKDSQNYGLEKIRYAISVKAGSPGFYVWGNFYLNDMWEKDRGPYGTEASQVNFGVAVTVF